MVNLYKESSSKQKTLRITHLQKSNIKAYAAWIAICIIWGTTYLAIRVGVTELPPMLFAGVRWIIAGLILITFLKLSGRRFPSLNDLKHIAVVGIALLGVANGLVVVAEQWIPSGLAALLISTLPFWMVGFESAAKKGPKINFYTISGLLIGIAGVFLIFGKDFTFLMDGNNLLGVFCLMGAVISWSLGSIYSKYKKINVDPLTSATFQMLIAGTLQVTLGLSLGELSSFTLNTDGILATAYLVLFGSIFGYASYIYAIAHLPLSLVSTYAYINPVIAIFLGWLILNEDLNLNILIAATFIIVGVIVVKRGSRVA
jgi:drug/metabolite transporter (DMT)-like permease